ncbi:glycosyltransferase family 4 protein [Geovibrio ferrireducens]|uniref:glycosyltransferase family 4 protein n=1 Tax=Geovibrio ferrireducens TaxID=46201 RepID=UPI0022455F7E|nr:glycosyltransferase family 4 protein [Geovibrio ferrireducens]
MKIVYASNSFIPSKAANSVHVMKMCNAFAKLGHEVVLISNGNKKFKESEITDVFAYYGIPKTFKIVEMDDVSFRNGGVIHGFKSALTLLQEKPDLVYGRAVIPCAFAAVRGIETIFESHSPLHDSSIVIRFFYSLLAKSKYFHRLVVISEALKRYYIGKQKAEILVAHDAADEADISQTIELKGRKDVLKIGYVGHLYQGRGIDIIVECAQRISRADFHIVGGNENDLQYWKSYSDKLGLANIFFYGHVSPAEAQKYRNSVDVLAAPYQKDVAVFGGKGNTSEWMSPLKIFEYMASKKPIICSDLPVLREVLNEGNSLLVKCDSIGEWVEAISLLKDEQLREKLAAKAYDDFSEHYTWLKRAESVLNGSV